MARCIEGYHINPFNMLDLCSNPNCSSCSKGVSPSEAVKQISQVVKAVEGD